MVVILFGKKLKGINKMKDFIFSDVKYQLLNHLNSKKAESLGKFVAPIILENDVIISVQASEAHYCYPKINYGIWDSVEVYIDPKYYKDVPDELLKYNEEHGDDPVMGYVPIDLVVAVIITSGGIDETKMENDDG